MKHFKTAVLENKEVAKNVFKIKFKAEQFVNEVCPGQFIEVSCAGENAPFLRRPFGIHGIDKKSGTSEILIKKLGRGTEILSFLKKGDALDIVGPLGKGFEFTNAKNHFVAGGGMGIAPLLFLARELKNQNKNLKIFLAARCAGELPCVEEFRKLGEVIISTDDGSLGEKCLINTPLERALKTIKDAAVYACGPHAMLRCVAELGAKYKVQTQISLEEKMACGFGVCQGCAVEVKNKDTKYKMVCKDGPVFNAEDILW